MKILIAQTLVARSSADVDCSGEILNAETKGWEKKNVTFAKSSFQSRFAKSLAASVERYFVSITTAITRVNIAPSHNRQPRRWLRSSLSRFKKSKR